MNIEDIKVNKLSTPELVAPCVVASRDTENNKIYHTLMKRPLREIYDGTMKLSPGVSEKIYDISRTIWEDLLSLRSEPYGGLSFLNSYHYVTLNNYNAVIDLWHEDYTPKLEEFIMILDSLGAEQAAGKFLSKVLIELDNNAIVVMDLDYYEGSYRAYQGVKAEGLLLLNSKPFVECKRLDDFIITDWKYELDMIVKTSAFVNNDNILQQLSELRDAKISLREMFEVLKSINADVITDSDDMVSNIEGVSDAVSTTFTNFINSFNTPFKTLRRSSQLKKSMRINDLTAYDMIKLLSYELLDENDITGKTISDMVKLYERQMDHSVLSEYARKKSD